MGKALGKSARDPRAWPTAALVVLCATLSSPALADAQALPDSATLDSVREALRMTARDIAQSLQSGAATADQCVIVGGQLHCNCLRWDDGRFDRWEAAEPAGVAFDLGASRLAATEAIYVDDGWALTDVVWQSDDTVLSAASAWISDGAVKLESLEWSDAQTEQLEVRECGAQPALPDRVTSRARSASWTPDDGWRVEGYRVGPWPLIFASSAERPALGLLPPTLRYTTAPAGSAQVDAMFADGLVGFADLAVGAPSNFGVGILTERRDVFRRTDVGLNSELSPIAIGDVDLGERAHLRGRVEHPVAQQTWELRRLEHEAFFRSWRATRLGASLSGPAHALQMAGHVTTTPELPEERWDGIIAYGMDVERSRFSRWTVDLEHHSEVEEDTIHSATASIGWRALLGSLDRLWVQPGADIVANYGAVTASQGFDASTTVSALASAEAGISVEGRFQSATHRVTPRLRVGGEILGVQQRQPEEAAPDYPYARPDRWRWAVAVVEQQIREREFVLSMPVGVFADALGDEGFDEFASPSPFGRLSAGTDRITLQLGAACVESCSDFAYQLGGIVSSGSVRAWYSASNLEPRSAAILWADDLTQRAHTAVRLINDAPGDEIMFGHHAGLRLSAGPAATWVSGRFTRDTDLWGFTSGLQWRWESLGWGLSLHGGWRPATDDVALVAGLALTP